MITSFEEFKKRKNSSSYFLIFIIFLALSLFLLFLNLNFKLIKERKKISQQLLALESELQNLESKKTEIENKISEIESEEYLEKTGREDLNLKKEGEKVVAFPVVKDEEKIEGGKEGERSIWQKLLEKLKIK